MAKPIYFLSRRYFTGRAPWKTEPTKIELFARSAIPQGESSFLQADDIIAGDRTLKTLQHEFAHGLDLD